MGLRRRRAPTCTLRSTAAAVVTARERVSREDAVAKREVNRRGQLTTYPRDLGWRYFWHQCLRDMAENSATGRGGLLMEPRYVHAVGYPSPIGECTWPKFP